MLSGCFTCWNILGEAKKIANSYRVPPLQPYKRTGKTGSFYTVGLLPPTGQMEDELQQEVNPQGSSTFTWSKTIPGEKMATYELKSIIIIIIYVTYGKETAPYSFW
jgi:hypothetical protein